MWASSTANALRVSSTVSRTNFSLSRCFSTGNFFQLIAMFIGMFTQITRCRDGVRIFSL